jgi:hypothetical protein
LLNATERTIRDDEYGSAETLEAGMMQTVLRNMIHPIVLTLRISRVVLSTAKHHVGLHALVSIASKLWFTLMLLEFFKWNGVLLL